MSASQSEKSSKRKSRKKVARKKALVTGAGGALAQLLCRKLHRTHDVIGVDKRPFPDRPKDVEHHRLDLRRKSAMRLLKKKRPDVIIHLGVMHNPRKEAGHEAFHYNLDVMSQLLELAEKVNTKTFVFLSTANLYGPSATSTGYLTEESPLLLGGKSPEVRDLISLDMMSQSFFWKNPDIDTVVLRPCHIVGPHLRNAPSKYLRRDPLPTLLGFDPMVQLVHELDLIQAIIKSVTSGKRGVFNVAGNSQAPLSRLVKTKKIKSFPVPESVFKTLLERAFRMRLTTFPSTELLHLKYSCLIDDSLARTELGYEPEFSLEQTILDVS